MNQPTFITINVSDFWRKMPAHSQFCIIGFVLPKERIYEIPDKLRDLLRRPTLSTKANRMGKIIRITDAFERYYDASRTVRSLF